MSVNVFIVQAVNPNWTSAGVNVGNGQRIWVDTQSIGLWDAYPVGIYPPGDANRFYYIYPGYTYALDTAPNLSPGALVGKVGTNTPFFVGDVLVNYALSGTGPLSMIINDSYYPDNTGAQMVRVIVVQ